MSKLTGGIFSNPSGKTAGIVFGAARTRQGKKVTARQLVPPSNPNTAPQQLQRGKFGDALDIVRFLGADIYQSDFNRAISQLPGFQSMMSVFMNAIDGSKNLTVPPEINLGQLHFPDTMTIHSNNSAEISIDYTSEAGVNGTASDEVISFVLQVASTDRAVAVGASHVGVAVRDDEADSFFGLTVGKEYLVGAYLKGAGAADGLLSKCVWEIVTVT